MAQNGDNNFDYRAFIAKHGGTVAKYSNGQVVYRRGDPVDALFYIANGQVKVIFNTEDGKEAVIAVLGAGDFFGEGCLNSVLPRTSTIVTAGACEIARLERAAVILAFGDDPAFSKLFLNFLLDRNQKLRADLIDQMFNSSEKRLARILLTLANTGLEAQSSVIPIPVNQETLAHMVGTTRSRINQFMNKFRKLGYIEYNGEIRVHNLLNLVLVEAAQADDA
jgi:CRP-like cAMP-binding protein